MGVMLTVHHRILYDTENRLWDLVSARTGAPWSVVQSSALGIGSETFEETCEATLELYAMAAGEVAHLMNARQHEVV